ncbi:MAG TPA: transglutaminase domain-containing protein [Gemmataceae bacterium]|nr:transglutaminase domain-containing protein [Gemmataceae bacterium]
MRNLVRLTLPLALLQTIVLASEPLAKERTTPRSRTFSFTYSATVTDLEPGKKARIWLPIPPSNAEQDVKIESKDLPAEGKLGKEGQYGNEMIYVEAPASKDGTIPLAITYRVTRREARGEVKPTEDEKLIGRFLQADGVVPIGGKSLDLIKDRKVPENQFAAARVFYDVVNSHMRYSKEGTGWGRGDSDWACDSKYGNCTDFHSMFISLARARKIPAKFEIGFPLPEKRGGGEIPGYHCWAWFKPEGKGWVPVDISEANKAKSEKMTEYYFGNLTEDRVVFTTGRDIDLVPKQTGKPLNFFVYPYVEVDDKPYDKVRRRFTFEDAK